MKWIALILLGLNIGFFAWQQQTQSNAQDGTGSPDQMAAGKQLFLLNEVADLAPFQDTDKLAANEPVATIVSARPSKPDVDAGKPAIDICVTLGPVPLDQDPKTIEAWLRGRDAKARLRKREQRQRTSTWVFLPPQDSQDQAEQLVQSLRDRKVEDYFLIKSGDMKYAVSLGLYSEETSVVARLTELRDKGFYPQTEPRFRTNTSHWLDAKFAKGRGYSEKDFKSVFPGVSIAPVACDRIAFSKPAH